MLATSSLEELRGRFVERLRGRREELAEAIFVRGRALGSESVVEGGELVGMRQAIVVALGYALEVIESGVGGAGAVRSGASVPPSGSTRAGATLGVLLRRWVVASASFWDLVLEEVGRLDCSAGERRELLLEASSAHAALVDGVVVVVAEAYVEELVRSTRGREQRCAELVRELLSGGDVDAVDLGYSLDWVHVALVARGADAEEVVRRGAAEVGRRVLSVARDGQTLWVWLGGQRELPMHDLVGVLVRSVRDGVSLAVGEPARGIAGFRTSHQQACAADRVAQLQPRPLTRYRDIALLALGLDDQALDSSLTDLYLGPLQASADGAPALLETLRAYFAAGHNARSAAAALRVHEQTVASRLQKIEDHLGYPINTRRPELETALKLETLGHNHPQP